MPWWPTLNTPIVDPAWWLWLGWSVAPDVALFASVVWLWRRLARTRSEARRQLGETRDDLARRTETLRWATELAEVGVWFWDLATGALEWTDRCKAQFALPPGRTPSLEHFYAVMHPEDRDRVRAAIDRSLADRQDYRTVIRVVRPDGAQHLVAALGRAQYDAAGRPVSMGGVTIDVTGLRKVEENLRALGLFSAEQAAELEFARRFKLYAENASDVVMETDTGGVIRWIAPSVKQRIGREPAEVVGERFSELVHPDERDRVRALESQVATGMSTEARLRLRVADDGHEWFSVSLRPVFDDGHAVTGIVGGWRHVHQEMQAHEALAAERRRLRATLDGMLDPIALIAPMSDGGGRIGDFAVLDVNPAACAWLEADRDRVMSGSLRESFPQIESSGLLAKLGELAETGRALVLDDFPILLRGSVTRRLDVRGIRGESWVSLAWRDVSDRHDAVERLVASEEQFRLLAENSTDVIVRVDANDVILWISPSVMPVLGWSQAECAGRDAREFLACAASRERYERDKAHVRAGQGTTSRAEIRAADGQVHWMEVHTFPYRTRESVVSGMVASLHVIDAEVRMERDLERRARVDELTGLLNRREWLERLNAKVARGRPPVGLVWCDVDGFKAINDAHGHAAGDAVLEALAGRIRTCLRSPDDIGGRIGGDELVAVLCGVESLGAAAAVAEDLRRCAAEPIPVVGGVIHATISVGVTLAGPGEGVDAILARADDAMYRAKKQGRNRVVALSPPPTALAGNE